MEELDDVVPQIAREARKDKRQRVLDTRGGEEAEHPTHLATQTAAIDQDEPIAVLRELVGELHGDAAAEGLADDCDPTDPQDTQEVA
jgi:hypothetical protein